MIYYASIFNLKRTNTNAASFSEEVIEKRNKILDEADVEEEKRDLITREIGKFREIMKVSSHAKNDETFRQF